MMTLSPYRLQIFLPEPIREALKEVAHREKTSLQQLTLQLVLAKIHEYPEFEHLEVPLTREQK